MKTSVHLYISSPGPPDDVINHSLNQHMFSETPNQITTDRLLLRRLGDKDILDVFTLMSDEFICRMIGVPVFHTLERTKQFINEWSHDAYAITEKGSDKVIGIVQLLDIWWRAQAALGYWLMERYRGKGYMTEAIQAITDAAFKTGWYNEIRIFVYVGNDASRRVALKCGFHLDYKAYKETVYTDYGTVESEECFCKTIAEHEWELRGQHFFTTANLDSVA